MTKSRRRKPRVAALAILMIAVGVGGLILGTSPAQADVDTAQAGGFGASIGGALTLLPPTPVTNLSANESTPPSGLGPIENNAVDINLPGILRVPVLRSAAQAGNLAGEDHFGFAAALAEVAGPVVGADALTADLIQSTCLSNGDGSSGTTRVVNLKLGGQTVIDGPVAPNTTLQVPGVLTVTLNEQTIVDAPGSTSIVVNGAHIQLLPSPVLPTAVVDIILAQSRCAVQGPDVLVSTTSTVPGSTTTTTRPSTTTTTQPGTTTTTRPSTTTTTQPGTTTTTRPGTTTTTRPSTTTTLPPSSSTSSPPSGSVPSSTIVSIPQAPTALSRTGANLQPLGVLSAVSLVLGLLLLVGSNRPVTTDGAVGPVGIAGPEKWGPVQILKAVGGAFAALVVTVARRFGRRRR